MNDRRDEDDGDDPPEVNDMKPSELETIPADLNGGFFVYSAAGAEDLCFADKNVISLYGCDTIGELRALTGGSFRGMVHPEDLERAENDIRAQSTDGEKRSGCLRYRICTKQGNIRYVEHLCRPIEDGEGNRFFCVILTEIGEEEYLNPEHGTPNAGNRRIGIRNPLTGLLNEESFYAECEKELADERSEWLLFAIDLPSFKLFNEWYGREKGDCVLSDIGHELLSIADRHGGVAGYFGGDDFALMVPSDRLDADELYERIRDVVVRHGAFVGFLPVIGASYSRENVTAYSLHDQASLAGQQAKGDLKSRVKFFSQSMVSKAEKDYTILSEFKNALSNGEITFFLQPQCRSLNGQIVGAEALARWIKPDGTLVPPVSFIPTLEQYGFVPDLDKHIWEEVCKWCRKVLDEGKPLIPVSVNISPVDIFSMDVPHFFETLIDKYRLPRKAVKIEITETAYVESTDKVRATVQEFRDMDFIVLMDDFGSGFSSLNMLRKVNVDILKLDANFLSFDRDNEKKGMHIIESVINMAKTMAIPVIVEGVETQEQCDYLIGLGIRYIQGYYFYKPMCTADFEALISDEKNVDPNGFIFKANEEFRIREFLTDAVYSDSMLNHIIGPAAIFSLHGEEVDIIRFNQMFYRAVNVPDFHSRLLGIQKQMPDNEVPELFRTLNKAYNDRLNGAGGVFTFKKPEGAASRFLIHFYFLNENDKQKRFYGSTRDVTEVSNLQRHIEMLSRFTSRTVLFLLYSQGEYTFEVMAHGLEKDMGLSRQQLEEELNTGEFCSGMIPAGKSVLRNIAQQCTQTKENTTAEFSMKGRDGKTLRVVVDADYVDDELGDVKCILSLRKVDS